MAAKWLNKFGLIRAVEVVTRTFVVYHLRGGNLSNTSENSCSRSYTHPSSRYELRGGGGIHDIFKQLSSYIHFLIYSFGMGGIFITS